MGFSGAIGSRGFDNSIGAGGIELPEYKRQRRGVRVPKARYLAMWFMAKPNGRARVCSRDGAGGITTLNDFSGNRNNLAQNNSNKKPAIVQDASNGRAAYSFDPSSTAQYLVGNNAAAFDTGSGEFDVYVILNVADTGGNQTFFGTRTSFAASQAGVSVMCNSAERLRGSGSNGSNAKNTSFTSNSYGAKGFFLLRLQRSGTTTGIYTLCSDGTTEGLTKSDGGISYDGGNFSLGALNTGSTPFDGHVMEVLAYKGIKLGTDDRNKVIRYLSTKYKLGL